MSELIKKLLRESLIYEKYFDKKLSKDIKSRSHRYVGRAVTWYGDPDQMIVISAEDIHGTFGNIYDSDKLEFVTNMIMNSENNVELECSYGIGSVVDFTEIMEEQTAEIGGYFMQDYDGKTRPNSTGDEELDKYVGTEEITYLDFMSYEPSDEIIAFFDRNRFSLIRGYRTSQELIDEIKTLSPDENDVDAFEQFLDYENKLLSAKENNEGDFNRFAVQLRDGHHRVMGAIDAGERWVCLNLTKESLVKFKEYYTRVNTK
jgi:hypothetical protein